MHQVTYILLAEGKWCNNLGGARLAEADANVVALDVCQSRCTGNHECGYISFNMNDGWCSTYSACGTPTERPNEFQQDSSGWATYKKVFGTSPRLPDVERMQTVAYNLIAEGKWCNNLSGARRLGADFNGYTVANCQAQCTKDIECAFISFDLNEGWCSKYSICGTPTEIPNPFPQDFRSWVTYAKVADQTFPIAARHHSVVRQGDCDEPEFKTFKMLVIDWYERQVATLKLFNTMGMFINSFDTILDVCAPAALMAILLKLESAYFEESQKWDELLELYITKQHQAVADGSLTKQHFHDGWPLMKGMSHVLRLRALGHQREGATDGTLRAPVDIVICYCAERLSWLRAFHKLPWRDENRSAVIRTKVSLNIYHKCGGYGTGVRGTQRQLLVDEWSPFFHSVNVRFVDDVLRADDDSAYIAYIVDHYDDLPEFTVFLHADAPEHIPSLDLLTDTVFASATGYLSNQIGFIHLAHNYVLHESRCKPGDRSCETRDRFEFDVLWKRVFRSSIAPSLAGGQVNSYCCVQFLTRRQRILLRPQEFYEHALRYFGTTAESYHRLFPVGRVVSEKDVLGRTPGQLAMYIWHAMFGEALKLPRRQRDPRLPLFIKLLNVEVEALGEEEGEYSENELQNLAFAGDVQQAGDSSIARRLGTLFD